MSYPYSGVLVDRMGGPVLYGPRYYFPALNDREIFGFITCTMIIAISLLVPYISYWRPQKRKEALQYLGGFVSIYLWCVIMVCNFGKEWLRGSVQTTVQYVPFNPVQIQAEVGLHVGLRGINVTLVGLPINQANETINYNEIFSWEWQQGILGFGPYGGRFQREYRAAIERGVPYPILWVAEWFTLEGEYIHWGRFARTSGWYTHILMWLAMCFWAITNLLFISNAFHGAVGLMATGGMMVLANIVFAGVNSYNYNTLVIPFPDGNITLSYGWCFIYNLITGLLCIVGGAIMIAIIKLEVAKGYFFVEDSVNKMAIKSEVINNDDDEDEEEEEMKVMGEKDMDKEKEKKEESDSSSDSSSSSSESSSDSKDLKPEAKMIKSESKEMKPESKMTKSESKEMKSESKMMKSESKEMKSEMMKSDSKEIKPKPSLVSSNVTESSSSSMGSPKRPKKSVTIAEQE